MDKELTNYYVNWKYNLKDHQIHLRSGDGGSNEVMLPSKEVVEAKLQKQ